MPCHVDTDIFLPYMAILSLSFSSNKPVANTYQPMSVTMVHAFLCTIFCKSQSSSTCAHFREDDIGPVHIATMCQNWDQNPSLLTPSTVLFLLYHKGLSFMYTRKFCKKNIQSSQVDLHTWYIVCLCSLFILGILQVKKIGIHIYSLVELYHINTKIAPIQLYLLSKWISTKKE